MTSNPLSKPPNPAWSLVWYVAAASSGFWGPRLRMVLVQAIMQVVVRSQKGFWLCSMIFFAAVRVRARARWDWQGQPFRHSLIVKRAYLTFHLSHPRLSLSWEHWWRWGLIFRSKPCPRLFLDQRYHDIDTMPSLSILLSIISPAMICTSENITKPESGNFKWLAFWTRPVSSPLESHPSALPLLRGQKGSDPLKSHPAVSY